MGRNVRRASLGHNVQMVFLDELSKRFFGTKCPDSVIGTIVYWDEMPNRGHLDKMSKRLKKIKIFTHRPTFPMHPCLDFYKSFQTPKHVPPQNKRVLPVFQD